ncbi:MAG: hypothetical protein GY795_11935 [Desulfobacterales bacterium]|nr:hypothetical protein [Desulfobacterales bacterium]
MFFIYSPEGRFSQTTPHILDGMAGTDTAVFTGKQSEYSISKTGDEIKVSDSVSARDGITFLKNIELLKFSDQLVNASD